MPTQSDTLDARCPPMLTDQAQERAGIEGVLGTPGKPSMHALFTERTECPLCAASASSGRRRFEVLQCSWPVDVLECPTCGIVYKRHVPDRDLMNIIYSSDYVHFGAVESTARYIANSPRVKRLGNAHGRRLDYGCGGSSYVRSVNPLGKRSIWDEGVPDALLPEDACRPAVVPEQAPAAPPSWRNKVIAGLTDPARANAHVANLLRAAVHLTRIGDHLEAVLTRKGAAA